MREDEPGNRRDGYPGRVREHTRLRQFVGPQPLRGTAVSAGLAEGADILAGRTDADATRLGVWGLGHGAVAAGLLMDYESRRAH